MCIRDRDIGEAVEAAFEASASETGILKCAACILRADIKAAAATSPELPWPPSASSLNIYTPLQSLMCFLQQVIVRSKESKTGTKSAQLATSIAADICTAATQGRWVMPKHIMLGMSLHHLTASAEVITIVNRYGHCQSYSKLLELETALGYQVQQLSTVLPSNIPDMETASHMCWDNFNINEETTSGSGTTHTTHGIVVRELSPSANPGIVEAEPSSFKTKARSFRYRQPAPEACYVKSKASSVEYVPHTLAGVCPDELLLRILCRALYNSTCSVPDWTGWLSVTAPSDVNVVPSNVGYLITIMKPVTKCATVKQCLDISVNVSQVVQQEHTFVTFDLAAARLAFNVVWNFPEKYQNVFVHLGSFHTMCAQIGALGTMMTGSGFEEIVIQSGICASGSIRQVLNGNYYNSA